jgi:hypothetical protein
MTDFYHKETLKMADNTHRLLRSNLKQLRLPAMGAEFEKLARAAAAVNEGYEPYLLRLTELEVAARASKALAARIRAATFPLAKDFDTYDFSALPHLPKVGGEKGPRPPTWAGAAMRCTLGAPSAGLSLVGLRPRRARLRFTRRGHGNERALAQQEQGRKPIPKGRLR